MCCNYLKVFSLIQTVSRFVFIRSGSWSILQTEQGVVGWANVWKTQEGAVLSPTIIRVYSLVRPEIITLLLPNKNLLTETLSRVALS